MMKKMINMAHRQVRYDVTHVFSIMKQKKDTKT